MRSNKEYLADSFVVNRNGRVCIPIKKQYKSKMEGKVIDESSSGATLFIEPASISKLYEEYEQLRFEEDTEERCILYTLLNQLSGYEIEMKENMRVIIQLDFMFAKAKMSCAMHAIEPQINMEHQITLFEAKHPLLKCEECVPLNFEIGNTTRGIVITGPNTGGKTVAIKTVALISIMACAGLHVPAKSANVAMNNQVLCDIGDGQNLTDNLSTFSSHIKNILSILQLVTKDSLVVLDELGSGTDPAEGMGIALAILEQLRKSGTLFLVTTHYPEVKEYANSFPEIQNARMAFDRDSLKPLYQLEIGKSGESCALYIAKRLGLPNEMLQFAAMSAYGENAEVLIEELHLKEQDDGIKKISSPKIKRKEIIKKEAIHGDEFQRGDSVLVMPESVIGIVVRPANHHGEVLVQIKKEKQLVNHKRLKLKVSAQELYPEDYDLSILFDSVENRKARHQVGKHHNDGLEIYLEE
jgi:dsDNA-specific endonuclease/ATPase MutS2